jgi:hypothetical protein
MFPVGNLALSCGQVDLAVSYCQVPGTQLWPGVLSLFLDVLVLRINIRETL